MRSILTLKVGLSGVIIGMMVNDGHYDLPVLLNSGSIEAATTAAKHYYAVAGGHSLIFEYGVPLMILCFLVLQLVILNRARNLLVIVQTVAFVLGVGSFSLFVNPCLETLAVGDLQGAALLNNAQIVAWGHIGLIALLATSIVMDRLLDKAVVQHGQPSLNAVE